METLQTEMTFRDAVDKLGRRYRMLVAVVISLMLLTFAIAVLLPSIYRSQATILIEQQEIPAELVRSTVTSFASQRIQTISQRVMTSSNLSEIIEKYGLYEEERRRDPLEVIIDGMRRSIVLEMISADVVDPRSGRPTEATIAFQLSYDSESPVLAQKVTNELVSLYLNENLKSRQASATETSSFLADESSRLASRLAELEQEISTFKQENLEKLPQLEGINRELMNRADLEITDIDRRLDVATQQEIYLSAQLSELQPHQVIFVGGSISPAERLRSMETELTAAEASYGDSHPDVRKLRAQVEAVRADVEPSEARNIYSVKLEAAKRELAELLERYNPDHPDVAKSRKKVENLELKYLSLAGKEDDKPNNPAYINILARLDATKAEIRTLRAQREKINNKRDEMTQRLIETPLIEQQYKGIIREYDNTLLKYQEITAKQMEAQLSENLETERKGEKFTLIEPPLLPEAPSEPNRMAILLIGLIVSIGSGVGSVFAAEGLDNKVRGRNAVQEIFSVPPLAIIPDMSRLDHRARNGKLVVSLVLTAVVLGAMTLAAIHVFMMPLDVFWYVLMRKLSL